MANSPSRCGGDDEINLLDYWQVIYRYRLMILGVAFVAMAATVVLCLIQTRVYQATTSIVPPIDFLQKESDLSGALGAGKKSLLKSIISGGGIGDMYVGIMKSRVVADAMIDRFDLVKVYSKSKTRYDARKTLQRNTTFNVTNEGIVSITVQDRDPNLAACMANEYVEELDKLNRRLSSSQASSKRLFLEKRLQEIKAELSRIDNLPTREAQIKEMLFELLARECELAKMEEAKSMPTIQVLDPALEPERPVGRGTVRKGIMAGVVSLILGISLAFARDYVAGVHRGKDKYADSPGIDS